MTSCANTAPWLTRRGAPKSGVVVANDVAKFSELTTKRAKTSWFKSQKYSDTEFIRDTSLDDDGDSPQTFLPFLKVEQAARSVISAVPQTEIGKVFAKFLEVWSRTRDFDQLVEGFIDPEQFGTDDLTDTLRPFDQEIAKLILQYWRALDHGRVAAIGHNVNLMSQEDRKRLGGILTSDRMLLPSENAAHALVPVTADRAPLELHEVKSATGEVIHFGLLRFRHARTK